MKNVAIAFLAVLLACTVHSTAKAQTCSCASVPLLGTMESASPNENQWYVATTYEFHDVSDLIAGSSSVPDTTGRDRTSEAFVVEVSRGLTEKWSVSALLAAVDHERAVGGSRATASGLGDAVLMVKYAPKTISLYSDTALSFGLGSRIPVGVDNAKQNGITLAEDMQPSMGSYAGMAWVYWAKALNESKAARIYASASHTVNSENDRDYMFGDDTNVAFGGSYQTSTPWGFNLELSYRKADRDQRSAVQIPNTGGEWLDIVPTVQYHITETLAVRASAKLPLKRDLNDQLQFTSKYAYRLTLSYVFGGNSAN